MFKPGNILLSPIDFDNAMFNASPVVVLQGNKIVDDGGPITKHTENAVFINGGYFLKDNFQFKVRL